HAGVTLKQILIQSLPEFQWHDLADSIDYPDIVQKLVQALPSENQAGHHLGILICGSGIGMSIAANKFAHIRAAVVWDVSSATLARQHNHANVLCLGARFLNPSQALQCVRAWLETAPSTETR